MTLFLLSTKGLGDFYVVESCPTSAVNRLNDLLETANYGHKEHRKVDTIKIIANELYCFPENKPNFSSENRLILPTSCNYISSEKMGLSTN